MTVERTHNRILPVASKTLRGSSRGIFKCPQLWGESRLGPGQGHGLQGWRNTENLLFLTERFGVNFNAPNSVLREK